MTLWANRHNLAVTRFAVEVYVGHIQGEPETAMSPQYTVKHDTDWSGNQRTVIREQPTGSEIAGTVLGMAFVARQKAQQRNMLSDVNAFEAAVAKGEFERALKTAESLASNGNRDIRGVGDWLRARALRYLGRPDEAIKAATAATQAMETSTDPDAQMGVNYAQCELGWANLMAGDAPTAIAAFTRAIKIVPKDEEAFNGRGIALRQLGNFEQSLRDLDQAIQINPGEKDHYVQRGLTYLEINDRARALADFTQTTRLAPDSPIGYRYLGQVYLKSKDHDKAIYALTQAVEIDPLHENTRRMRAVAYQAAGKQPEADADIASVTAQARARVAFDSYRDTAKTIVDPLYKDQADGKVIILKPSEVRASHFHKKDAIPLSIIAVIAWGIFAYFMVQAYRDSIAVFGSLAESPFAGLAVGGIIPALITAVAIWLYRYQQKRLVIWRTVLYEISVTEARMPGFGMFLKQYVEARNSGSVYSFTRETRRLFDVGGEAWPYVQNA